MRRLTKSRRRRHNARPTNEPFASLPTMFCFGFPDLSCHVWGFGVFCVRRKQRKKSSCVTSVDCHWSILSAQPKTGFVPFCLFVRSDGPYATGGMIASVLFRQKHKRWLLDSCILYVLILSVSDAALTAHENTTLQGSGFCFSFLSVNTLSQWAGLLFQVFWLPDVFFITQLFYEKKQNQNKNRGKTKHSAFQDFRSIRKRTCKNLDPRKRKITQKM